MLRSKSQVLKPEDLNGTLPVLPLPIGAVLLPSATLAVQLFRQDSLNMLEAALKEAEQRGSGAPALLAAVPLAVPGSSSKALVRSGDSKASSAGGNNSQSSSSSSTIASKGDGMRPAVSQLNEYGCAARIAQCDRIEVTTNGKTERGFAIVIEGLARLRVDRYTLTGTPFFEAQVTAFPRKSPSEDPVPNAVVERLTNSGYKLADLLESLTPTNNGKRPALPAGITPPMSALAIKSLKASLRRLSRDTADELSDILMASLLPPTRPTSFPAKVAHLAIMKAAERVTHAAAQLEILTAGLEAREAVEGRVHRNAQRQAREAVLKNLLTAILQELRALKIDEMKDNNPQTPTIGNKGGNRPIPIRIAPGSPPPHGPRGDHDHDDSDSEDEEEDEMINLRKKIKESSMHEEARNLCMREWKRLTSIPPNSMEHGVLRNYLDWMTSLPWGKSTFDLPGAQAIDRKFLERARDQLENDHFGIQKVKERLLQYLAVLRLKNEGFQEEEAKRDLEHKEKLAVEQQALDKKGDADDVESLTGDGEEAKEEQQETPKVPEPEKAKIFRDKGPIICLVGPPGVGKTSIARSLATAMGRPFSRASLGGIRDESEIRGHRRTYVGSMPGIFIHQMRKVGVNNPVILLDEIDKMSSGSGAHGDPSAAMLEVLDPEQNHTFTDHYINTPVDLSSVLFIATANSLETIPPPLLDRMEVIHLSGYVDVEKLQIAKRYLLPKQIESNALQPAHISIDDDTLLNVVNRFCGRESGVRNLERQLGSVCRWKAVELANARDNLASGEVESIGAIQVPGYDPVVAVKDLDKILGHDFPDMDDVEDESDMKPGCSVGLGYTGSGTGCLLFVEVTSMPGKGGLRLTGSLGDVITESAQIALSWVKANAFDLGLAAKGENIMQDIDLHIHLPSGAMKKDGPSAGVAMTLAILSLFSGQALDHRLAMTGEITLRGKVTPVGGIREKCLAANRAGVKRLILPERNRKDAVADLPQALKDEVEIHFVDSIWQAIEYAFPSRSWNNALTGAPVMERKPTALLTKL